MNLTYSIQNNILKITGLSDFSLDQIFTCGQCFRWDKNDEGWYCGIAGGRYAEFRDDVSESFCETVLYAKYVTEEDFKTFWYNYFDLGTDYGEIKKNLAAKDGLMEKAVKFGGGIRILNQEPFETLISFIISANNNIPRIKKCVFNLCKTYGEPVFIDETAFNYKFPEATVLSKTTSDKISEATHLGYRCPYIVNASLQYTKQSFDPSTVKNCVYDDAKKQLLKYMGVGPKVADCVLLFTGARRDAFPIDVWMARIMEKLYFSGVTDRKKLEKLSCEYFGEYAGIAQQYLFYYGREFGFEEK